MSGTKPITINPAVLRLTPDAAVKIIEAGGAPTPVARGGESFKLVRKPGVAYKVRVEAPGFDPTEVPLTFTGEAVDGAEVVLVKTKGAAVPETPPNTTNVTPPVDKPKPPVEKPKTKTTGTRGLLERIGAMPRA